MRTPIFAAALGFALAGCVVGDLGPGTGPGDDDGPGSNPGSNPTPKLDVSVDKTALSTELLTTNMVTVTLTASGGFSGPVALAASAVDPGGATLPAWDVTLDKTNIDMTAGGTTTAVATLKIPADAAALAGTLKVSATSSLGAKTTESTVAVTKQLSLTMTISGTTCAASNAKALTIAQGTKVRWVNGDATRRITIHVQPPNGGGIVGFDHEPDPGMAPNGGAYEQTAGAATGQVTWYCHAPGQDANRYTINAAP